MARSFSNSYITVGSAPVTAAPLTTAAWFNSTSITSTQCILSTGGQSPPASRNEFWLLLSGSKLWAGTQSQIAWSYATSTAALSNNVWYHACGVYRAANDRSAYINGGNRGNDNVSIIPAPTTYLTRVGQRANLWDNHPFFGSIGEFGVWNVALTDEEVAILAKGYSPLLVRPQSLIIYVPLIRGNDKDIKGGLSFSAVGIPGITAHPRVFYIAPPKTPIDYTVGVAAASLVISTRRRVLNTLIGV